mgnify:CR=1 FL=1
MYAVKIRLLRKTIKLTVKPILKITILYFLCIKIILNNGLSILNKYPKIAMNFTKKSTPKIAYFTFPVNFNVRKNVAKVLNVISVKKAMAVTSITLSLWLTLQ